MFIEVKLKNAKTQQYIPNMFCLYSQALTRISSFLKTEVANAIFSEAMTVFYVRYSRGCNDIGVERLRNCLEFIDL